MKIGKNVSVILYMLPMVGAGAAAFAAAAALDEGSLQRLAALVAAELDVSSLPDLKDIFSPPARGAAAGPNTAPRVLAFRFSLRISVKSQRCSQISANIPRVRQYFFPRQYLLVSGDKTNSLSKKKV